MKHSKRALLCIRSNGFTLVELLVVISIIAILAAVILGGGSTAINAAKRVQAANTATQIQTAIYNYDTEYGVYPVASTAPANQDTYYDYQDTADWKNLMIALCGGVNPLSPGTQVSSTVPNVREIPFLSPKRSDIDTTNGILFNPFSTAAAPKYFYLIMDADYDGVAGDSGPGSALMPDFSGVKWTVNNPIVYMNPPGVTQGVAIWANCDPNHLTTPGASTNPHFWVHTY